MPSPDTPEVIVARFLRSSHYHETLGAFLQEAGLPPDAGAAEPGCLTLEKVLEEKRRYDASLVFEKVSEGKGEGTGWRLPAPSEGHPIYPPTATSNILAVHVPPLRSAWSRSADSIEPQSLFLSTADRKITIFSTDADHRVQRTIDLGTSHNSPVLCIASITSLAFMTSSMSGHVELFGAGSQSSECKKQHAKYSVQVIITPSRFVTDSGIPFCIAASAGWDQTILLYSFEPPATTSMSNTEARDVVAPVGDSRARLSLPSNPESILFVRHPDTDKLYLIVGRRDSTYLYFYQVTEADTTAQSSGIELTIQGAGRQNLAPHANSWVSFSPSCIASCPTDLTLVAVATSHLPHMKLIIVRLLFPGTSEHTTIASTAGATQASQARAELALQDSEEAAIMTHVSTMAPQTPYSTPQVVWRPDGSGLWVNGDDGVVRGVEARTGKVTATLKGHEAGSKIRTLWAGMVRLGGMGPDGKDAEVEWLVSGGFDKKVVIWKAPSEEARQ